MRLLKAAFSCRAAIVQNLRVAPGRDLRPRQDHPADVSSAHLRRLHARGEDGSQPAGHPSKPRAPAKTRGDITLPSFRGETVNGLTSPPKHACTTPSACCGYHTMPPLLNLVHAYLLGGFLQTCAPYTSGNPRLTFQPRA